MKNILLLLFFIPVFAIGQTDSTKSVVVLRPNNSFNQVNLNENLRRAGLTLQRASNNYMASMIALAAGAIISGAGIYNNDINIVYAGSAVASISLVYNIAAWLKIRNAGLILQEPSAGSQ